MFMTSTFAADYTVEPDWDKLWLTPDWTKDAKLGASGNRSNVYKLPPKQWQEVVAKGRMHTLFYPVDKQKVMIPHKPLKNFFEKGASNPLKKFILKLLKIQTGWNQMDQMFDYVGLHPYPATEGAGVYQVPFKKGIRPDYPMGVTLKDTPNGEIMTVGCAGCHAGNLFGKKVIGLTNRFPHANEFFLMGKKYVPLVPKTLFKLGTNASKGEVKMFKKLKKNLKFIEGVAPQALGLDTSLAHTGLSLSRRLADKWATKHPYTGAIPRPSRLRKTHTDSKPAVWWNLKYKTKWLSDASIISGNPIFTNFLWNEIGRGQTLEDLGEWFKSNKKTIIELTAAVFAAKPPRVTDFFPASHINLDSAKRGEKLFNKSCRKCHGTYTKAWSGLDGHKLPLSEQFKTTKVRYHQQTLVKDVGTSDLRRRGMGYFLEDLNRLELSKLTNTVVVEQPGYIPPPLDGIWARWPYLHNNSIPSLCQLLTPEFDREKGYWMGASINADKDFDFKCNGYPSGAGVPSSWKAKMNHYYDNSKSGLSNLGHSREILIKKDGSRVYSDSQVLDLVAFLQTL